jgi:hypothetical protein
VTDKTTPCGLGRANEPESATSSIDIRRRQLGTVLRGLAADLVEERGRGLMLEREVRQLRATLAACETDGLARGARPGVPAAVSEDMSDAVR